ncbi:TetR/AcrR family transcriptional regulator [Rhodococcus sp. BP-252]|uniref:Transcriptional regulator n=1 Tax=Rhodococcoides kyotonense TaxID=398843 RepID=A0A177YAM4_9NOCA|nr:MULTISPECIES: TetR/AcrR family transcriptional regulator [Rhodococcus]MBY6411596.1 TetR/AcrR family transcriptional regulator [Rhodococcus sp. BP-320]MBY6417978.1 TetR/AcrR family transcriptional regulator [Rhodococcus sp. BP-321]MBY6422121.1 TetR/AcrR family transcriptional regulator [Rhodococcus sp. BP-324]MBY6427776.1 TetR/AcrR family transcriptional regulator [Rhodococcus sp. BP-323]MBY6433005.1 TetR/AcrR family transcriptional regulator [Rhodococcus sp. BP-322]
MTGKKGTARSTGKASEDGSVKRAAHRPSRREMVIDAAMHLYSVRSIEDVTVADIAAEAQMTSAAVYYHYPSKDDVLLGGLRLYSEGLLDELRRRIDSDDSASLGDVIVGLLEWTDQHRPASLVYFVHSPGWSLSIESLRRSVRLAVLNLFMAELRTRHGITVRAKQAAAATALSSLLEVSMSSWLTEDAVLANLGRRRFSDEVRDVAADIASL